MTTPDIPDAPAVPGVDGRGLILSPRLLAAALGRFAPTEEQEAVIAAPLDPLLVVAGAGAGKTETMAARVVWLVANRVVDPEQVLGLTFTRKAAQQLSRRIRGRLRALAGSEPIRRHDADGSLRRRLMEAEPQVSTYHSYAGRLLSEYGLLLPMESSAVLLGETELWQLAYDVVTTWRHPLGLDSPPGKVTEMVLRLRGEMGEHLVEADDIRACAGDIEELVFGLPKAPRQGEQPNKKLLDRVETQRRRVELLPLVEALDARLADEGALDFGAQMSLAARLVRARAEVGEAERARFRVVLLDEYQDTGFSQRLLLSGLFGAARLPFVSVTAVGDPMQAIYGWRGASEANLPLFTKDFPRPDGRPAERRELLMSWRNPPEVLGLANAVSEPLRGGDASTPAVSELRPRPEAPAGEVRIALHEDVDAERAWVADAIADRWQTAATAGDAAPTTAVLVRRNRDSAPLAAALEARGLPVEIVGVGGLLDVPEIIDVVSVLRLLHRPDDAAALRLLTGARTRLGPTDLRVLRRRARELSIDLRPDDGEGAITDLDDFERALEALAGGDRSDTAGLVDAVADPGPAERYTDDGYARLRRLAADLHVLRGRVAGGLLDLVAAVEETLGIGVEVMARAHARGRAGGGREHLDAFAGAVAGYAARGRGGLGGLLGYLDAARQHEDGLTPGEVTVAHDRVQILTVHKAKGLEWEVVAVPHVSRDIFPGRKNQVREWLGTPTELPADLRGDREEPGEDGRPGVGYPVLDTSVIGDRKELEDAIGAYRSRVVLRSGDEDRRLYYVALTRSERVLLVSGSHWEPASTSPRGPSELLTETRAAAENEAGPSIVVDPWVETPATENPFEAALVEAPWPVDPLGERRAAIERAATAVRAARDAVEPGARASPDVPPVTVGRAAEWAAEVDVLLAERARAHADEIVVARPSRLSASDLVRMRRDPEEFAARVLRPLPRPPQARARQGTIFHAWLEDRFRGDALLSLADLDGAADDDLDPLTAADLEVLKAAFLASPWAERTPVAVELGFSTVVAGTRRNPDGTANGAVVHGKIDAVFREPDGTYVVVDWKTGAYPSPAEQPVVAIQLAGYRFAWARLATAAAGPDGPRVRATDVRALFWYVREGRVFEPGALASENELRRLVTGEERDEQKGATVDSDC